MGKLSIYCLSPHQSVESTSVGVAVLTVIPQRLTENKGGSEHVCSPAHPEVYLPASKGAARSPKRIYPLPPLLPSVLGSKNSNLSKCRGPAPPSPLGRFKISCTHSTLSSQIRIIRYRSVSSLKIIFVGTFHLSSFHHSNKKV